MFLTPILIEIYVELVRLSLDRGGVLMITLKATFVSRQQARDHILRFNLGVLQPLISFGQNGKCAGFFRILLSILVTKCLCFCLRVLLLKRAAEEKAQALRAATASSFKSMLKEKGDINVNSRWSRVCAILNRVIDFSYSFPQH